MRVNDFPSKTTLIPFDKNDDDFLLLLLVVGRRPEVNDFPTTFRRRRPLAFESAFVVITGFFSRIYLDWHHRVVIVGGGARRKKRKVSRDDGRERGRRRVFARSSLLRLGRFRSKSIVGKRRGHLRSNSVPTLFKSETTQKRRHRRRLRALRRARTLQSIRDLTRRMHRHTRRCPDDMCTSRPRPTRAQRGRRDDGLTRVVRQKRQDAYDGHVRSRRETTRENHGILHVRTERRERRRGRDGKPHEIFRRDRTETVTTNAGFFEVLNEIETTRRTKRKRKRRRRF